MTCPLNAKACEACYRHYGWEKFAWCPITGSLKNLTPESCPYYLEQILTLQKYSEQWIVPIDEVE